MNEVIVSVHHLQDTSKLSKKKNKWRIRVSQFMNPNSVIRILVIPVTHQVRNWHNLFSNLFHIRI